MRPKGTPQELERRRRRAIALLQKDYASSTVARMVNASPGSVTRWKQAYQAEGDAALNAKSHRGPHPKLSPKQRERLERFLRAGPTWLGYANELWTLARVAEVIHRQFGVRYDPSGVWHLLRRMGWSCQKPERRARQRNEQAIAEWHKKTWPRIKKSP